MAEEKPRLARLAAIMTQLQSKRLLTARELAEKHGVSIRTIYRDIRTLEQSGMPIYTEEGKGYSLVDGYHLPPVSFTEEEAMALITAAQLIERDRDRSLVASHASAILKIKSILRGSQKDKAELLQSRLQIRNNHPEEVNSDHLMNLQLSIANSQRVWLDYISLSEENSERKVEPFAIYTTQGNWILLAYCLLRDDMRAFRLDRIKQMRLLDESFEPLDITLEEYMEQCRKKYLHP
ncbi:MAG: YafY family protein [Bacteroidota bacterium]